MAVLVWIFLDQIRPKWDKLDQTWSNWISHQSKNVSIKSCHIYKKNKNGCFIIHFFGSDLSKMDQTWSNWFFHQSRNVSIKSCRIYKKDKYSPFLFDFFWIRSVQNGSNLIKLDFSHVSIKSCHIFHEDKNGYFIFDFFGSDQTWFLCNQKTLI